MFFSKSGNKKPAQPKATVPGVRAPAPGRGPDFVDTTSFHEEVGDIKKLPDGEYHRLPDDLARFEGKFAVLKPRTQDAILIIATDAYASPEHWSLYGRLKASGIKAGVFCRATRDVIQALHARNKAVLEEAAASDVEQRAFDLVDRAVGKGASDIHIETRTDHADVYFRIYGERVWEEQLSFQTATDICNTLYMVHAEVNSKEMSWNPDTVKEAVIEHTVKTGNAHGKSVQLRFESTPIHPASDKNFQAVIRVLVMEAANKPLASAGYSQNQRDAIDEMLIGAQGMVVIVGPTNSGKSTTMQAMMNRLREMRGRSTKIVTVEDPVEYVIDGACQMGLPKGRKDLESGNASVFNTFLKATLRLDPDVVMVGEIRDAESAAHTKDLVLAGRKLLTTLHAFESFAVFERLKQLGVPPDVLYMEGFISGVIYQRLVPTLCPHCALPLVEAARQKKIGASLLDRVERVSDYEKHTVMVRNREGCPKCDHKGIAGRTPCAELIIPDATFLSYLRQGDERGARAYWHGRERLLVDGIGVTAVAHAISKMQKGLLDPQDIEAQLKTLTLEHAHAFGDARAGVSPASFGFGGRRFSGPQLAPQADQPQMKI